MTAKVADLETSQECYDLNSLAKSHLISHYTPSLLTVQFPHPLNTCLLVSGGRGEGGREGGRGEEGREGRGGRGERGEEGGEKRGGGGR